MILSFNKWKEKKKILKESASLKPASKDLKIADETTSGWNGVEATFIPNHFETALYIQELATSTL